MFKKLSLIAVATMMVGPLCAKEQPVPQDKGGGKIWWCEREPVKCFKKRCPKCDCPCKVLPLTAK